MRACYYLVNILLITLLISCKTVEYIYPDYLAEIPEEPKRFEYDMPNDYNEALEILTDYDYLVKKWENWAKTVKEVVKSDNN